MKLTGDQQHTALEKLQHFFDHQCDCGHGDWILSDKIFELREFHSGNLVIGGNSSVLPVISVSCKACGNTQFFNALLLGLVEKNDGGQK